MPNNPPDTHHSIALITTSLVPCYLLAGRTTAPFGNLKRIQPRHRTGLARSVTGANGNMIFVQIL